MRNDVSLHNLHDPKIIIIIKNAVLDTINVTPANLPFYPILLQSCLGGEIGLLYIKSVAMSEFNNDAGKRFYMGFFWLQLRFDPYAGVEPI